MLKVKSVDYNSIGFELGIKEGDFLTKINGKEVEDILDYLYLEGESHFLLEFKRKNRVLEFDVEKDDDEFMGIEFEDDLKIRTCQNKCVFCFVDQMPKGLRDTLYVKDDDYRMSFISGTYVTLTNDSDKDIDRIIKLHLSPIYISVQATSEKSRCELLNNRFAGKILDQIKRLADNGIEMHTQVVLCPGLNDGKILEKTIEDLHGFYPHVKSVAIVPVGLTKFREGLTKLNPFTKDGAVEVIDLVNSYNAGFMSAFNEPFIYPSDEFYILAEREIPDNEFYGDYLQIENGVGMVRRFLDEWNEAKKDKEFSKEKTLLITGVLFYPILKKLIDEANCPHDVLAIKNDFFGHTVTVAGLLTGNDIINQIGDKKYDRVIIPGNVIKEFGDVFLDDVTLLEFEKRINAKVILSPRSAGELFDIL